MSYENISLPFPDGLDGSQLENRLGKIPNTPLELGVARTISHFRAAIKDGRLPQTSS